GAASLTALSLAFSAPAQAITTWNWSFTGDGNQSATGTFTTADVTPQAGVTYTITGITGTYNRDSTAYTITGLSTDYQGPSNTFQWNGTPSSPLLSDFAGISFDTTSELVNMYVEGSGSFDPVNSTFTNFAGTDNSIVSSTVTPVPLETDALPVVGAAAFMGGGIWWKKKRAGAKVADFIANK
ncbi:MAG: hypothetical protein ACK5CA_05245, partial [Cyanobacteriota bacterium]